MNQNYTFFVRSAKIFPGVLQNFRNSAYVSWCATRRKRLRIAAKLLNYIHLGRLLEYFCVSGRKATGCFSRCVHGRDH